MYNFGMDSLFFVCFFIIIFVLLVGLVFWFFEVFFEKGKKERRKIKEFGQEHNKKTTLLLNGVNTDLLV